MDNSTNSVIQKKHINESYNELTVIIPIIRSISVNYLINDINKCISSCSKVTSSYSILIVSEISSDMIKTVCDNISNVYYIIKSKTGLAETLNAGIKTCNSKYVAIHYPDNDIYDDRFKKQWDNVHKYDVVFNSTTLIKYKDDNITSSNIYDYSISLDGGAMIFKRETLMNLPYMFEEYYDDMFRKLCLNILYNSTSSIWMSSDIVEKQILALKTKKKSNQLEKIFNFKNDGELTCILAFRNEGIEVEKTVQSIRYTANNVRIILINDGSDKSYDYRKIAKLYKCEYREHTNSAGSAYSKNEGVYMCNTEYFLLLDAHMRFYTNNWDVTLLNILKSHEGDLICLNTFPFKRDNDGYYINEKFNNDYLNIHKRVSLSLGAYVRLDNENIFDTKWIVEDTKVYNNNANHLVLTPCVLGAAYAGKVFHWKRIQGYNGLEHYGFEEPFISIKTFLLGGNCYVLRNLYIGHLYRDTAPYKVDMAKYEANRLFLSEWFYDIDEQNKIQNNVLKAHYSIRDNILTELNNIRRKKSYNVKLFKELRLKGIEDFEDFNMKYTNLL